MLRNTFNNEIASLLAEDNWLLAQEEYDRQENLNWESRFGLVSGYMSSRGSEICATSRPTLPATYIHGIFDRSEAFMRELANMPDWAKLKVYVNRQPIGVETEGLEDYLRALDMKNGLLASHYTVSDASGARIRVESLKLLSRAHPQCGLIRLYLTPLDSDAHFELENLIDGTVTNFIDYPRFRTRHFEITENGKGKLGVYMECHTRDFKTPVGIGACVEGEGISSRAIKPYGEVACEFFDLHAKKGQTVRVDKFAAIATGRDTDGVKWRVTRLLEEVTTRGADAEIKMHIDKYQELWRMADLEIEGDDKMQKAMRFNIFHLMSTPNPYDDRVNIGPKLMHGEEYGGHAYWDTELFCLPFFTWVFPKIARNLVNYRGHLLDAARRNARDNGYLGAKYPWESADTGDEECPSWSVEYDGTCTRCYVADYEHHVTSAVAFGLVDYVRVTGDRSLFEEFGLELLLETARFWSSRMVWSDKKQAYEILQVTGPDEWHEPVDNNYYTNRMAVWNIHTAVDELKAMQKSRPDLAAAICQKIALTDDEINLWLDRAAKIYLPDTTGVIEQFEGYFDIPDAVITQWDDKAMPIMPESCVGKERKDHPILKQADVVMLMKLLPDELSLEVQRLNYDYYEKRTLHRSSLSPSAHAQVGVQLGLDERAYQYLERSSYVDIDNNQRNLREGLHAASIGGTWQAIVMGYCGMHLDKEGELAFSPKLPERWNKVRFRINWRGKDKLVTIENNQVEISDLK